jgi:hypothetical protein
LTVSALTRALGIWRDVVGEDIGSRGVPIGRCLLTS